MKIIILNTIVCIFIPMLLYLISYYLFIRELKNRHKLMAFECGFDSFMNARIPFSTRFFLLAVIFIVFDIEIVLLFPIPLLIGLRRSNLFIFLFIFFFLFFGLLHEWNEGAIDWIKWEFSWVTIINCRFIGVNTILLKGKFKLLT